MKYSCILFIALIVGCGNLVGMDPSPELSIIWSPTVKVSHVDSRITLLQTTLHVKIVEADMPVTITGRATILNSDGIVLSDFYWAKRDDIKHPLRYSITDSACVIVWSFSVCTDSGVVLTTEAGMYSPADH